MPDIRILILGTGGMSHSHATAFAEMDGVQVVAAVNRSEPRLLDFCAKHDVGLAFSNLEDALKWGQFDAVSNVTSDAAHHSTTLQLLASGKHVLCEKPLASTEAEAIEMADAAAAAGVVNMINLSYRDGPALMHGAKLVADGLIGEIRHFEASYLQSWLTQPLWGPWENDDQWLWKLSTEHGSSGALGDIGAHVVDFATLVAGSRVAQISARLKTYKKAEGDTIRQFTLDANDGFSMQVELENGAIGVIHGSRTASGHVNDLRMRIFGTKGGIEVRYENGQSLLFHCAETELSAPVWREITPPAVDTNYTRFIRAIRNGQQVTPDFARGAEVQMVLERARQSHDQGMLSLAI